MIVGIGQVLEYEKHRFAGGPSLKYGKSTESMRAKSKSIFDRSFSYKEIISVINKKKIKDLKLANYLGKVIVLQKIVKNLQDKKLWKTSKQKHLKII